LKGIILDDFLAHRTLPLILHTLNLPPLTTRIRKPNLRQLGRSLGHLTRQRRPHTAENADIPLEFLDLIVEFAADGFFCAELFLDFVFGGGCFCEGSFEFVDAGVAVLGEGFEGFEFGPEGAGCGFLG
jgi:hypothetical protein